MTKIRSRQQRPPTQGEREYLIGYGKPPKGKPFRKGQTGNAKGRPRGAPNLATVVRQVVIEEIVVTQGSRQIRMRAFEAMVRKLRQEALAGKTKSLEILLALMREHCAELLAQEVKKTLSADDQALIADFRSRMGGLDIETDDEGAHPMSGGARTKT